MEELRLAWVYKGIIIEKYFNAGGTSMKAEPWCKFGVMVKNNFGFNTYWEQE